MPEPMPSPMSEPEYQAIEATITQTARGRWFLAEFARRNRAADAQTLLGAVCRLEEAVERASRGPDVERLRHNLVEMARMLVHTRNEIAALRPVTAQRVDQAVHVLRFLESRVNAMLAAWHAQEFEASEPDDGHHAGEADALIRHEASDPMRLQ